jgi:hypothetical protein
MITDQDIVTEIENVHCEVTYSVVTDTTVPLADQPTETKTEKLCIKITGTNASTQTYSELQDTAYTAPETAPAGLAENIYAGVSQLHYDGTFELVGIDPPGTLAVGNVANLSGSRAEWAAMVALVQKVALDVDMGRTTVKVGWPRQLMPADLMQLWRANRSRKPVEDSAARNTGMSGNGTGDGQQALGKHHHAPAAGAAAHVPPGLYTAKTVVSGAMLAVVDLTHALANGGPSGAPIYPPAASINTTDRYPRSGDAVLFYHAGQPGPFLKGIVTSIDPRTDGDTLLNFAFTANGNSGQWYLHCAQIGAYTPP